MPTLTRPLAAVVSLLVLPAAAIAQSGVAGVARDSSGGVLPGVTVEAASDALIERVRTVVTDGNGQYRILDLRPGTYTVTFSLTGFTTVRREGLELGAEFVATVNADLRVSRGDVSVLVFGPGAPPDLAARGRGGDGAITVRSDSRMPERSGKRDAM